MPFDLKPFNSDTHRIKITKKTSYYVQRVMEKYFSLKITNQLEQKIRILVSKGNSGVQMRRIQRSDVTTAPRACMYDVTLSKF